MCTPRLFEVKSEARKLITIRKEGSERIVRFAADHINEMSTAREIAWEITEWIEDRYGEMDAPGFDANNVSNASLSIDMSEINMLGSVGLNELINVNRQARLRGVELVLANVQDPVRDIFALTRLERMFQFAKLKLNHSNAQRVAVEASE